MIKNQALLYKILVVGVITLFIGVLFVPEIIAIDNNIEFYNESKNKSYEISEQKMNMRK